MKRMLAFFAILMITCSLTSVAQSVGKQILNLDGTASKWAVSLASPAENKLVLTDENDDFYEGGGALKVDVAIRYQAASWGTWTDANYTFATPVDISGADDIRFKMKILTKPATLKVGKPPSFSRALQFTFDLMDSSASGNDLWRYQEDLDIFYTAHRWKDAADSAGGWFDFVIPIKSLRYPTWQPSTDGKVDLNRITKISFGVHGDSTAMDSVVFLIDDIRATKATTVGTLINFDGTASTWVAGQMIATNKFVLTDNADDSYPGSPGTSMKVDVALRTMGASWGVWTNADYTFATPQNIKGATELKFWIKILTPTNWKKGCQFTIDIADTTGDFYRWVNGGFYGLFIRKSDWGTGDLGWFQVAVPLNDMLAPSWASPKKAAPDLGAISRVSFGVHSDSTKADSVVFLIDDLTATKGDNLTSVRRESDVALSGFELGQNYPNPFNPTTSIKYSLNASGMTTLTIYNILGQVVKTAVNQYQTAGSYTATVDMSGITSGVYFYVLEQGDNRASEKMMLIK